MLAPVVQPPTPTPPAEAPPTVARLVVGRPQHRYALPGESQTVADLATTEFGRALRVETEGDRTVLHVPLSDGEALWGFGERMDRFNQRGNAFDIWAEDCWNCTATSYFAVPWFISSAGYGLFVNCTGRLHVDCGATKADELRIDIPEDGVEIWTFFGPPRDALASYSVLVGRPHTAPDWTFQPWISRNSYMGAYEVDRTIGLMETNGLKAAGVVLEAWEEQLHNFRFESARFPDAEDWIKRVHERGYHVICWITSSIWPGGSTYDEARKRGYIIHNADGSEYATRWIDNGRELDFRLPGVSDFWRDLQVPLVRMGVDGFKTDGGEHVPDPWFHNEHPFYYQRASLDAFDVAGRTGITFARSADPLCAGNSTFWGGDQEADWKNLAVVIRGGLSAALSGYFYWSHDVGGYTGTPVKDLYLRWLQIGALSPMMQLHGVTPREPWRYDAETLAIARGYFRAREKLQPYLVKLASDARERGLPMWRPLAWAFPDDPTARDIGDQFMLGDDLLLAPILDAYGARHVHLPAGDWVDLWSGAQIAGPTNLARSAALYEIPAYARATAHGRWKDLFADVPRGRPTDLYIDLAGDRNERGVVPTQRYLRGQNYEKIFYTVHNHTKKAVTGTAALDARPGLKIEPAQFPFTAPAGGEARLAFYARPNTDLAPGSYAIGGTCRIGARTARLPHVTLVKPPAWKVLGLLGGGVRSEQDLDGRSPDFAAAYAGTDGREIRWKDVPLDAMGADGYLDLGRIVGGNGGTTCYAFTTIRAPSPRRARIYAGCGDAMTLWVNGQEVLKRDVYRNPDRDEDTVDVALHGGDNAVLVRISRSIAQNGMYFRVE